MKKINLIGNTINGVKVISEIEERFNKKIKYNCKCKCGKKYITSGETLRKGNPSCGCYKIKHNASYTREYGIWKNMIARCHGLYANEYYTSKGIKVCKRWRDFNNFIKDMGNCPKNHSIDRIDNNGSYHKDNCRWASHKQQMNNTSRNVNINYKNNEYTIQELSDKYKINRYTLLRRLNLGWDLEKALNKPIDKRYSKNKAIKVGENEKRQGGYHV